MSEPTREERIEGLARWFWERPANKTLWTDDFDGYREQARLALNAAGLDSLLAERDRLREAAEVLVWAYDRSARRVEALRAVLGEPVPEDGNEP